MTRVLTVIMGLSLIAFPMMLFQNCSSDVGFGAKDANIASVQTPEGSYEGPNDPTCVSGKRLGVWADPNESGTIVESNYLGSFIAYSGTQDSASNYNYFSHSAHPVVGPTPIGFETNFFFYEGADGLSLNLFSNVDEGGSTENIVNLDIEVSGNGSSDSVILSDDNAEIQLMSSASGKTVYEGRFHYWSNTDGGVIGPFSGDNYKVQVKLLNTGDVQSARFYSAGGSSFSLEDSQNQITSFIIAYVDYQTCQ